MTNNKKSPFLLRAVIVVVALAVGAGLNIYLLRGSHVGQESGQEPAKQETVKTPEAQEAPKPLPSRDFNVASPFKGSGTNGKPGEVQPEKPAEGATPDQAGGASKEPAAPGQPGVSDGQQAAATSQTAEPAGEAAGAAKTGEGQKAAPETAAAESTAGPAQPQATGQGAAQAEQAPQAVPAEQAAVEKPLTKAELRAKAKAEAAEKAKAAAQARAEARAKAKAEAEEKAKAKAEARAKAKAEAAEKAKAAAQARAEAKAKAKAEAEEKAKAKAEEKAAAVQAGAPAMGEGQSQPVKSRRAAIATNKLLTLKTEETPGEFTLTLQCDKPVDKIDHFATPDPARLVFDLGGVWRVLTEMTIPVQGDLVERIRLGLHPDKLRLVLDFKNKEMQQYPGPTIERQENTVVIRLPKIKAQAAPAPGA